MTFDGLCVQLLTGIKIPNESIKILGKLEIDFKETGEVGYGFCLAEEKNPTKRFYSDVKTMIEDYEKLSEDDKKRAYIFTQFDMIDRPRLYLGLK